MKTKKNRIVFHDMTMEVPVKNGEKVVNYDKVMYIECDKPYCMIHCSDGVKLKTQAFQVKEELIKEVDSFDIFKNKQCLNCIIFPNCMGGCLRRRLENQNNSGKGCENYKYKLNRLKSMILNYYTHFVSA